MRFSMISVCAISTWAIFCLYVPLYVMATPVPQVEAVSDVPVSGGLSDVEVNDEYVRKAAAFAVSEINKRQNSVYKQVLVQVVSAQAQAVAGTLYHLRLEVGSSNCRKGQDDANSECSVKEASKNQLCDVKVWERLWENKREVTEVSCSPKSSAKVRQAGFDGGLSDADVNDQSIKDAAKFALQEVDKRSNSAYKHKLVRIICAQTQVVAGALYDLKLEVGESNCEKESNKADSECPLREGSNNQLCEVKVWENLWENKREVMKVSCSPKSSRKSRQAGFGGGLSDADVNDESIKDAAKFALQEVDKRSNSVYRHKLVRIASAQKQVVAGTLYHLKLEVGESNCEKGSNKADSECYLREGSNNQLCDVKVWERLWENKREVMEVSCSPKSSRKSQQAGFGGGLSDADVSDESIKDAAKFALQEVDKRSNSAYKHKLLRITSAQKQYVAGVLYHLKLEVGESNCEKGSNKADSECYLREESSNQTCTVKVWDRPWLNKLEVTELQCLA